MKILILGEFAEKGGTMSFLKKFIRFNYELANNVILLIESYHRDSNIKVICDSYNYEYHFYPTRSKLYYNPYISILYDIYIFAVYIQKHSYDLLFISNSSPWMFLILNVINKKTIYFVHSYPDKNLNIFYFLVRTIPLLLRKTTKILTVSKYSKSQLIKYIGIKSKRIDVVYNSCTTNLFQTSNQKSGHDIILTLGRLTKIKNPYIWLDVAERVSQLRPTVKFVWVGADKIQMADMYILIKKKKLNQFVEIIKYVDNPNKYLINTSIYFQPSLSESHGIAVIDAMAAGLPCVVSDVGGMRESVIDNETGFLINPKNVSGFVEKIITLLENEELARTLGSKGKIVAKKLFSENMQKHKLETFIQS